MIEGFLLGLIVTTTLLAAAFFLKFWRQTRDPLFLAFAASFAIEGVNRMAFMFIDRPQDDAPIIYAVRLTSYLLILGAIAYKNRTR
jgi:hypothetical protein